MTSVKFDRRNSHFSVEISGHANYAPHGQDIVCAGVSLLSFMLHKAIQEAKVITDIMGDGYCIFVFSTENEKTIAAIDTIASGYQMLSEAYPNYVSFASTDA